MKNIFKKYLAGFIITFIVFLLLLGFTVARYIMAMNSVEKTVTEASTVISEEQASEAGWNIPEIMEKKKEVNWLERQLILAKSDSLNLGISLADSIVQVQLKGTILLQARILKQNPMPFLETINFGAYHYFTKINSISEETATIVKRPVKKVQAPKNENEANEIKHDTIPDPLLVWQFKLDNQLEIVVTGVGFNKDSLIDLEYNKDILKYNTDRLKKDLFPKNYTPTLYLWLNDKDAKAIYRAIPERGKVVFRNL